MPDVDAVAIHPLTPDRWSDLEALFGEHGAVGGCWCMFYRLTARRYEAQKGDGNRLALKALVDGGRPPGLLAYDGDQAVAWVSVAPRQEYARLSSSRVLKPVDSSPVWSLVCLFVRQDHRRRGLSLRLVRAAVAYAASQGARIVEAYPLDIEGVDYPAAFAEMGFMPTFVEAGFTEVTRHSPRRPIMRYYVNREGGAP
jgi:GNAT superfamily N-acetyltransferase